MGEPPRLTGARLHGKALGSLLRLGTVVPTEIDKVWATTDHVYVNRENQDH